MEYLKGVREEFGKITWPTQKTTLYFTIAVVCISLFFAAYLGILDYLFSMFTNSLI